MNNPFAIHQNTEPDPASVEAHEVFATDFERSGSQDQNECFRMLFYKYSNVTIRMKLQLYLPRHRNQYDPFSSSHLK